MHSVYSHRALTKDSPQPPLTPPTDVYAFTDAVIRADGLHPCADAPLDLRRDVRARVAGRFQAAEDGLQFGQ